MLYVALGLIGLSIYILTYEFFKIGALHRPKSAVQESKSAGSQSLILRLCMPIVRIYLVPSIQNFKIHNYRKTQKRKIMQAGMGDEITPDELFGLKLFLAVALPFISIAYNITLHLTNPLYLILFFGPLGFFFSDFWLNGLIKTRNIQIRLAIPFVVDLMSLCTEAGLDFMNAMQRVVKKAKPSPLIEELDQVLREIKVGSTRAQALRHLADRVDMPEISSLVAVLVTADQMGTNISDVLKAQSEQTRVDRFIRAEKEGAKASQKILMPTMLFIVPAVFIVILGPVIAKFVQKLLTGGVGSGLF
jgi:tight adherence protein C